MKEDIPIMYEHKFGNDLHTHSEAVKRRRAVREEEDNLWQQPRSRERSAALKKCWDALLFLDDVERYYWNLWRADWYKEKADTKRVRLEKLRRFQKEYG